MLSIGEIKAMTSKTDENILTEVMHSHIFFTDYSGLTQYEHDPDELKFCKACVDLAIKLSKGKVFIHRDLSELQNKLICRKCSNELAISQIYCHMCGEHIVEGSYE